MAESVHEAMPPAPTEAQWSELLSNTAYAAHYTSAAFFNEPYFENADPLAVMAYGPNGALDGVLTGVRKGRQIVCGNGGSPQLALRRGADPETIGITIADNLIRYARHHAELVTVYSWERSPGLLRRGFREKECSSPDGTILLDLERGAEQLFKEFSATSRNQIRHAIREKVEVTVYEPERDFADYYRLYTDWCGFKGLAVQPPELQRRAFADVDHRLVLVARHEDKLVGVSTFRYRDPGIIEYAANLSRREETKIKQNDLLLWRAIEWACARPGIHSLSMGSAQVFSRKFGGECRSTYRYRLDLTFLRRHDRREALRTWLGRAYRAIRPHK